MSGGQQVDFWTDNGKHEFDLPGGVHDYFYQYGSLAGDEEDPVTKQRGHFGYKVLALSYGGTLQLRGRNGTAGTTQMTSTKYCCRLPTRSRRTTGRDHELRYGLGQAGECRRHQADA